MLDESRGFLVGWDSSFRSREGIISYLGRSESVQGTEEGGHYPSMVSHSVSNHHIDRQSMYLKSYEN